MLKITYDELPEKIGDKPIVCTAEFVFLLDKLWWRELVTYEVSAKLCRQFVQWGAVFYFRDDPDTLYIAIPNPVKFGERSKAQPFTMEDWNGRTVYFNDGVSEYIETEEEYTLDLIEQLKSEAE